MYMEDKEKEFLKILLSYDPIILLLDIYPAEMKTKVYTKTFTQIFIATLFIVAKLEIIPDALQWVNV